MAKSATPTVTASTRVYDGRVIHVERDALRFPDGRTVTMDVVRHRGSVVLVPQPSPGRIILIRQYRYVVGRWIWELPAGTLEPGEAPARAARRECEEEIGLRPRRVKSLGRFYPTPGFCDERMTFYLCTDLETPASPAKGDEDEQIEPRAFTLQQAWEMVDRKAIIDMKTVMGLVLMGRLPGLATKVPSATRSRKR